MGIGSWNYLLEGDGCSTQTELNRMSESGRLIVGPSYHEVLKQGFMSGTWVLEKNDRELMAARKPNPFTRTMEIVHGGNRYLLESKSAFGRTMLLSGRRTACEITPAHSFTRRASISGQWQDFMTVAFAFWLTSLMWKRAAQRD
jgi:hypothetical protein